MNFWFFGETGTGKTRWVWDHFREAYPKMLNKWWCHYNAELGGVVVINEFGPKYEKLSEHLKKWTDHYPFIAEMKGRSAYIRPRVTFVTSNYAPEDCFKEEETLMPILRRFRVYRFPEQMPGQDLVEEIRGYLSV